MDPRSGCPVGSSVLVIEDDEGLGQTLAQGLRDDGFAAIAFASGEHALRHVVDAPPDLFVVDLNLAEDDMPGFLVVKALRTRFPGIPLVVVTGCYMETSDEVEARALGVSDYLFKPFEICELSASLRAVLASERPPRRGSTLPYGSLRSAAPARPLLSESKLNACENAFIDVYQRRLERSLRHSFPRTDLHIIAEASAETLLEFVRDLERGIWPLTPLRRHLRNAAWRNVRDALQWFTRRHITETRYAASLSAVAAPEFGTDGDALLERALDVLADTPAERQALRVWIDGGSLPEIGQILVPELVGDYAAKVREAKRFKDRVRKRARDRRQALLRTLGRNS